MSRLDGPRRGDLEPPGSALVIVAHPDDAEFQCGATLAKWARSGCVVHHLVLTDGSKGTWDPDSDVAELVARRRAEQLAAAEALGAGPAGGGQVVFLEQIDGELEVTPANRARVAEVIRHLRPQVVLGHDPWKRYRLHPDHRAAGWLCVDSVVAARDPFFHPQQLVDGLSVHRPDALLLFEADEADHAESVTQEDLEAKLAALEAHTSQLETTHFYRLDEGELLDGFRRRERERLEEGGRWAGVPMAETYRLVLDEL